MKRTFAILISAALLALLAFGCGNSMPGGTQLTDPHEGGDWTAAPWTTTEAETTEDENYTDENDETTGVDDENDATAAAVATTAPTAPGATTTRAPGATQAPAATTTRAPGQPAATTTTRPATIPTTTTTRAPTQPPPPPTQSPPGGTAQQVLNTPINITSNAQALERFNSTVGRIMSQQAGFNKSHGVAYSGFHFDPTMTDPTTWGIPPALASFITGDPTQLLTQAIQSTIQDGAQTAQQVRGSPSVMIQNSTLRMEDLRSVSFSQAGNGNWTITLNVNNGTTHQTRPRLLAGSGFTGSAPMQRGPIRQATDFGTGAIVYDHMCASRAFAFVASTFSLDLGGPLALPAAQPVEIRESTTNGQYVMVLDRNGNIISLQASYNQLMEVLEIQFLGSTFRDNRFSTRVTVNYTNFVF